MPDIERLGLWCLKPALTIAQIPGTKIWPPQLKPGARMVSPDNMRFIKWKGERDEKE